MNTFIIDGGKPLVGDVTIAGAKNVALKILTASLLTSEHIVIHNVPHIADVTRMIDLLKTLGVKCSMEGHTVSIGGSDVNQFTVPLDVGARLRTSSMVLAPLLARFGKAIIPNPGGCRLGARPIDRHIDGLIHMGATIAYDHADGFFHATANGLYGTEYTFEKNTHTGTETLLLAAVLAKGTTTLKNAAEEVEIDDLIRFLNTLGAKIKRTNVREITVIGVGGLHGGEYTIMPDRNEEVTFVCAAAVTRGSITVHNSRREYIKDFLEEFRRSGGEVLEIGEAITRYQCLHGLNASFVTTAIYPGFMTDWQAPWAVAMTQANGISTIHETVFESRFSYVSELKKMGAQIDFFDPEVKNPETFYNFNWSDRIEGYHQGIKIKGPTELHNAVLEIDDLRAGATLVLAALAAEGESYVHGAEQMDRGYEHIEERFRGLGATMKRIQE